MGGRRRTKNHKVRVGIPASAATERDGFSFCGITTKRGVFVVKKTSTKKLTQIALLIATEIILTRCLAVQTPIVRISFGFLPIAVIAMLYGAVYAGVGAAIADLIGITLFPTGMFFPGFTLTAFLTGVTYGCLLHNNPKNLTCICTAALIVTIGLQLGLDTLWIRILTGNGYLALLPARTLKVLIMTPIQILCIRFVANDRFYQKFGGQSI